MADIVLVTFDEPHEIRATTSEQIGLHWSGHQSLVWIPKKVIAGEVPKRDATISSIRLQKWWADKWLPGCKQTT